MGYCGGSTSDPTYQQIGDHTETLQLDYDPQRTSYSKLLRLFWDNIAPTVKPFSTQYKTVIFYHGAQQHELADRSRRELAEQLQLEVHTEIVPAPTFYLAEDYHQKYYLRSAGPLYDELSAHYPTTAQLIRSTAAARINGYVGGHGTLARLEREIDGYGLSEAARARLLPLVARRSSP